jgi:hypothetical protein
MSTSIIQTVKARHASKEAENPPHLLKNMSLGHTQSLFSLRLHIQISRLLFLCAVRWYEQV